MRSMTAPVVLSIRGLVVMSVVAVDVCPEWCLGRDAQACIVERTGSGIVILHKRR